VIHARQWGDIGSENTFHRAPSNPRTLARLVATWITDIDATIPAALLLEPLNPTAKWAEQLEGLTFDLDLDLDAAVITELRRRFAGTSSIYGDVRNALAHPRSAIAQRFGRALRDAQESGVMGPLMYGNWDGTPRRPVSRTRSTLQLAIDNTGSPEASPLLASSLRLRPWPFPTSC